MVEDLRHKAVDCIVLCGPHFARREALLPQLLLRNQEYLELPWVDTAQSTQPVLGGYFSICLGRG